MTAFTLNLSTTANVDDSIVQAYAKNVLLTAGQAYILEPLVQTKFEVGAKSIQFPKYSLLGLADTPLTETDDPASEALVDTKIVLTPKEYGKAVTKTNLASLQTGGLIDLAASTLVGKNMGQTRDKLIVNALLGSTNTTGTGTFSGAALDGQYSKLATKSIMPAADDLYVAVMSEHNVAILRNESGFIDVQKYGDSTAVLKNEIGTYKGHRIVRHQFVPDNKVISVGWNALGCGISQAPGMVLTGPFDKLARFVNVGWYGVFDYDLIDVDAIEVFTVA